MFNCSTNRCKYSDHGHSYTVEFFFSSDCLDNGMMVMDFGLMKKFLKPFIDSFDHAYSMWSKMPADQKEFYKTHSQRWIEMPVSPSAEAYALLFLKVTDEIIKLTEFNNGERNPHVVSVRVHETDTGYAEAFRDDLILFDINDLKNVVFSDGIKSEWEDPTWWDRLLAQIRKPVWNREYVFINPTVEQQV